MASGITIDGSALFNSGNARMRAGALVRAVSESAFPGLDGIEVQDLGKRSRDYVQTGELRASANSVSNAQAALNALVAAIEAKIDGSRLHSLTDDQGHSRLTVEVVSFEETGERLVSGAGSSWLVVVDYRVVYRDTRP